MIYTTLDDFYLTPEQLANSPSRQHNVDAALEDQLRRYGCDIISEAAILLSLPSGVASTAQVLLQRFYCKLSLAKEDVKVAAMAAFWLAAKLEEVVEIDSPFKLKLRDVLMVFYRTIRRREGKFLDPLDPYSMRYDALKTAVVNCERRMLRAFGFIVHVEHPHRFVLTFGQLLGLDREVLQEAWNLANDSLRTTLCVRHKAEVVACGILFMAGRRLQVPMPENPPWWELFKVTKDQLFEVCRALHDLYNLPRPVYVALGRDFTSRGTNGGPSPPPPAPITAERAEDGVKSEIPLAVVPQEDNVAPSEPTAAQPSNNDTTRDKEVGPDNVDEVEVGREVGVEAEIEGDGDIVAVGVGVEIVHMENDSQIGDDQGLVEREEN